MKADTVLIVEDDLLTAAAMQSVLQSAGYTVLATDNGLTATQIARAQPISVAIMDIDLGSGIDGITTAHAINEQSFIAIIFVTKMKESHVFESAKRAFPVNFIFKPFDSLTLLRAVDLAIANAACHYRERRLSMESEESIFIAGNYEGIYRKILYKDIVYVKASRMYTQIVVDSGAGKMQGEPETSIKISMPLSQVLQQFRNGLLVRVNRSYYVNLQKVDGVQGASLRMGSHQITVTEEYKKVIFEQLTFLKHLRRKQ